MQSTPARRRMVERVGITRTFREKDFNMKKVLGEEPKTFVDSIAYYVLRLIVIVVQAASNWISSLIVLKHKMLFMPLNSATSSQQWQLLRDGSEDLKKAIPKHICLAVIDSEKVNFEDISKIAVWCHALGVKFISFFDTNGVLHNSAGLLKQELQNRLFECRQSKDSIVFLQPGEEACDVDIHDTASIARVLDLHDGQEKVGIVVGKILNEAVKAKEGSLQIADINYNVKEIERQLSVACSRFPDPECVLCFGPVNSTMGLMPWQLNHSEIIKMDSHHNMLPSQFLQALERYTKIEKRFGK